MNSQDQNSQKNDYKSEKDDGPQTLAILQDIRKGLTDPKSFCPDVRRLLVSFLMAEGHSTAEIAHLLKTSDRTIERDKKAIREENTITKEPKLAEKMAGMLYAEAGRCIQRIRKFQRDSNASPAAKMEGEQRCFQIASHLIERLQSLGFLPTAVQRIEADLMHHAASSLTLEEIQREAGRLKQIEESLPSEGTKQVDSAIEANEIVTEFEDDSPQQNNNKGGNNHETTK
jgi:transposase